ncbi:MAG TPA: hypothetical protein VMC85_23565 [Desulfomonilaceae bacterium]|nr:hypothetical protein [Desulfomonilaceae bacterium]
MSAENKKRSTKTEEQQRLEHVGHPRGASGFEWKTRAGLFGIPLICVAYGTNEKGKRRIAKGFIAIGQFAVGGLAIAQYAVGVIGIGQFAIGIAAFGQLALSLFVGFGQAAVGVFAVGQFVAGRYARGQFGWAEFLWSPGRTDMEAVAMFETIDWLFQQDFATIWENIKDAMTLGL